MQIDLPKAPVKRPTTVDVPGIYVCSSEIHSGKRALHEIHNRLHLTRGSCGISCGCVRTCALAHFSDVCNLSVPSSRIIPKRILVAGSACVAILATCD